MKSGKERIEEMIKKGYDNPEITNRKYNLLIGLTLLYGFIVNIGMCILFTDAIAKINYIVLLIGYFVLTIAGVIIVNVSNKPIISFLGYNLVVIPIGATLTVILDSYQYITVINAFITTAAVTAVMIIISSIYPNAFSKMGRGLFISLLLSIIVEIVLMLFGMYLTVFDWIVAIIFTLYIGYDWSIAQKAPKTIDNAVDNACGLYLDIINLFLRILRIFGRRSN